LPSNPADIPSIEVLIKTREDRELLELPSRPLWASRLFFLLFTIYTGYLAVTLWGILHGGGIDLMMLTGGGACVIGLYFGLDAKPRVHRAIRTLKDNGVLSGTADQVARLHARVDAAGVRNGWLGALLVPIFESVAVLISTVLVPWIIYPWIETGLFWITLKFALIVGLRSSFIDASQIVGLLAVTVGAGAIVGWGLGHFAAYGKFQHEAEAVGCGFQVQPGSADGMGGLQPFVSFLRGQAILTLMPALWVSVWLILTCVSSDLFRHYGNWRAAFFLLLGLSVFYSRVGFLAPARMLERALTSQEEAATRFADAASREEVFALLENARRRITPRSMHFYIYLGILGTVILASGVLLPTSFGANRLLLFLIGPPIGS
jgi:hypothetical protein